MSIFDNYIAVDWSANSSPKSGADSIWIAWLPKTSNIQLFNPKTRFEALKLLKSLLIDTDGRVLAGFDFPFGYPKRFFDTLGHLNWSDLWNDFSGRVKDFKDNKNNRFEVADHFNSKFSASGPFWGYPAPNNGRYGNIPYNKPTGYGVFLPSEKRLIEQTLTNAKSVWQLNGVGCVGGQALLGIPIVDNLRKCLSTSIWPFEMENSKVVCAEIYPSIFPIEDPEVFKDASQVKTVVNNFFTLDLEGQLEKLMKVPMSLNSEIITHEGWILGAKI